MLSTVESTLLKTPPNYPYQEKITKKFCSATGRYFCSGTGETKYNNNEHIAFLGRKRTNPFHNQKFELEQIILRLGLGITLDNYQLPCFMCFDLTSSQQTAHDFVHQKLTKCSVSPDLQFSNALTSNLEIFCGGIRSSNVFIMSDRKVAKNFIQFRQSENE